MKKIDYFIPVIVIFLVSILGYLMYEEMNKSEYSLDNKKIDKLLSYDLKDANKKLGKETNIIVYSDDYPLVYCYEKESLCLSVDNKENVNAIIINTEYPNNYDGIKINTFYDKVVEKYDLLITEEEKNNCIVKKGTYLNDKIELQFISNEICDKEKEVLESIIIK